MADFSIKRGDRLPKLRATLLDADDAAINLTGCTVAFRIRSVATGVTADHAGAIVDAAAGIVEHTFGTEADTVGLLQAEVIVTFPGGQQTIPSRGVITIEVVPSLTL